jgi:DNA-binding winged helix-turn-helix (wHTH) protein
MRVAPVARDSAEAARLPTRWRVSDLVLDTRRQRVWRDSQEIPLPKLSYDLFAALVRRSPEVASNEDLMKLVWPGLIVSPETVSQRVKLLRDALGDDSRTPRYIGSLRARGYHLVPPVEVLPDDGDPGRGEEPARRIEAGGVQAVELSVIESVGGEARRARPDWAVTVIPTEEMRTAGAPRGAAAPTVTSWHRFRRPVIGLVVFALVLGLGYLAYRHGM